MKYYLANKSKGISVLFVAFLSIFCVYTISSLVSSMLKTARDANVNAVTSFSFVTPQDGSLTISEDDWTEINSMPEVGSVYPAFIEHSYIDTILAKANSFVVFMDENDLNSLFQNCHYEILDGRLPKNGAYEIIMNEVVLRNKGLRVGDFFGSDYNDAESVAGHYKIVGSFRGDDIISFGTSNFRVNQYENIGVNSRTTKYGGIILPQESLEKMNFTLDNLNSNSLSFQTQSNIQSQYDDQVRGINLLMTFVILIVAVSISIALGSVLSSVYQSRMEEYGILFAIGYRKAIIFISISKEILLLFFASWVLGVGASILLLKGINLSIFSKMGQNINLFNVNSFCYTLFTMVIMFGITLLPIIRKFAKTDLVTIIERR